MVTQKSCVIAVKWCTLTFKLMSILHALPEPMETREWKNSFRRCWTHSGAFWWYLSLQSINVSRSTDLNNGFQLSTKKDIEWSEDRWPGLPRYWASPPYPLIWEWFGQESACRNPKLICNSTLGRFGPSTLSVSAPLCLQQSRQPEVAWMLAGYEEFCLTGKKAVQSVESQHTVTCRVVRVTRMTGSSSDDWIYWHFSYSLS
jgi:hypothetical protein